MQRAASAAQYELLTDSNGTMELKSNNSGPSGKSLNFQTIDIDFETSLDRSQYVCVCLMQNPDVSVCCSNMRITGLLSVALQGNYRVNKGHVQQPDRDIGVDTMEFWIPERWPKGHSLALQIKPPIEQFGTDNLTSGICRPVNGPNAWVADVKDPAPTLTLRWDKAKTFSRIELSFDTDWDHPMESVLMGHPYNVVPFCVRKYCIIDALGNVIYQCKDNHQTRNTIFLDPPVTTDELRLELTSPDKNIPVSLFEIRCYE